MTDREAILAEIEKRVIEAAKDAGLSPMELAELLKRAFAASE